MQQRLEAFELRGVQRLTPAPGLAQPGFAVTPVSSQPLAALCRATFNRLLSRTTTALLDQPDRFETALLQGLDAVMVRTPKRCHFILRDSIRSTISATQANVSASLAISSAYGLAMVA